MSTVLGFEVFPLRDELQKIGSMSSFGGLSSTASQHHQRRTGSGSVVSTTSHGSSSNHHQHPVLSSTLEDSGNANNRGILQSSQSSSHHQQQPQRYGVALSTTADYRNDSSTVVNIHTGSSSSHGAEGAFIAEALIVKRTSSLSLLQKQPSSATLENNINKNAASNSDSNDAAAAADSGADRIVEEKRKRAVGDGYSIHRYTLGRLLGKGGFAKVYLCTAMDTGKNYAVKVVPKANLVKTRARQKVRNYNNMCTRVAFSCSFFLTHHSPTAPSRNQNSSQLATPLRLSIQTLL